MQSVRGAKLGRPSILLLLTMLMVMGLIMVMVVTVVMLGVMVRLRSAEPVVIPPRAVIPRARSIVLPQSVAR